MSMRTMKKVFLIAVCTIVCLGVSAQMPVGLGIKGGVNMSDISKLEDDFKIGFNFGVAVDYEVADDIFVMSGLHLMTKGAKSKEDVKFNPMYLQVPVHVGYKLQVAPATKLVFRAGPYAAYGIAGKVKSGSGSSINFFGDNTKKFDMGVGGAVGVEFLKFTADLGVDLGVTKMWDNSNMRNRTAYLSVGYKFW